MDEEKREQCDADAAAEALRIAFDDACGIDDMISLFARHWEEERKRCGQSKSLFTLQSDLKAVYAENDRLRAALIEAQSL